MKQARLANLDVTWAGGPDREGGGAGPILILMHGFGAPGDDLVSLWRVLDVPRTTRFLFPAGPLALPFGFGDARAWWMIDIARIQELVLGGRVRGLSTEVPEGLDQARASIL